MTSMHAPGNAPDLDANLERLWTETVSNAFDKEIEGTKAIPNPDSPRAWFYNAAVKGFDGTVSKDISWTAFPKKMKQSNWAAVDQERNLHEEYCEWEVARKDGKVVRVTFTTETADYYNFLWENAPAKLLELYQRHVSANVKLGDLGTAGAYNPQNQWNWPTANRGALMHMAQRNNTLQAAINLAAQASWPIVTAEGLPVTSEQELIAAIPFGDSLRHSDPHIGAQINELVRGGNEVCFADPVSLYIHEIDLTDFETPDGSSATRLMRITRGTEGFMLRVVFEAPQDAGFALDDVLVGGRRLRFGSQIAEKMRVRIRGAARPAAEQAPELKLPNFAVVGQVAAAMVARALPRPSALPGLSRILSASSTFSPE